MSKHCKDPNCKEPHYKIGLYKYHYKAKTELINTKKHVIKSMSFKQYDRLKKYRVLRDDYMKEHPLCEAKLGGCLGKSDSNHHKKGRIGDDLFKHFMATCSVCHEAIERMGKEVYDLGFKIKRI